MPLFITKATPFFTCGVAWLRFSCKVAVAFAQRLRRLPFLPRVRKAFRTGIFPSLPSWHVFFLYEPEALSCRVQGRIKTRGNREAGPPCYRASMDKEWRRGKCLVHLSISGPSPTFTINGTIRRRGISLTGWKEGPPIPDRRDRAWRHDAGGRFRHGLVEPILRFLGLPGRGVDISAEDGSCGPVQGHWARAVSKTGDGHRLPFDRYTVFPPRAAITSLEFTREPGQVIREMIRCTRPGEGFFSASSTVRPASTNREKCREKVHFALPVFWRSPTWMPCWVPTGGSRQGPAPSPCP